MNSAKAGIQTQQPSARQRPQTGIEISFREWTFLIPKQDTRFRYMEVGKFFKMGWDLMSREDVETG